MSLTDLDKSFLEISFKLAEEALTLNEVPVGGVFVYNNVIIGRGLNQVNKYFFFKFIKIF